MKWTNMILGSAVAIGVGLAAIGTARADWDHGPSFSIGFAAPPVYYAPPPPVYYAPPPPTYYPPPPPVYYAPPPPPPTFVAPAFPAGLSFGITLPFGHDH